MTGRIELMSPSISELSDDDLAHVYAYPDLPSTAGIWVRANFVTSIDGAVSIDGRSGPLSNDADRRVFLLLRALADVILVGAGTVRAEGYGSTQDDVAEYAHLRPGRQPVPPIAVVTQSGELDTTAELFRDNIVPPIILTGTAAREERLQSLRAAGAEIVVTGDGAVSIPGVLAELGQRGFQRILCEGGPQLFASLLAAHAIDELCLTLAPTLVGGHAPRVSGSHIAGAAPTTMRLVSVLHSDDSLLLRYLRK